MRTTIPEKCSNKTIFGERGSNKHHLFQFRVIYRKRGYTRVIDGRKQHINEVYLEEVPLSL